MAVQVTQELHDQIEEIRQSGVCNMLDRPCVQAEASDRGFYNLVVWIEDHKYNYSRILFEGVEVVDDSDGV